MIWGMSTFNVTYQQNLKLQMVKEVLQFCVTQGHMRQGAIAKKSGLLSQHETPPQLSIEQDGAGAVYLFQFQTQDLNEPSITQS